VLRPVVILETMRGLFRVTEVYYPRLDEINRFTDDLAVNEVVYMRQMPASLPAGRFATRYVPFETSLVDLTRDEQALLADMSRTGRHQVRKADRLRDSIEVRCNDNAAYRDFLAIHNDFVVLKRHSEKLSEKRLEVFKPVSDVFVAYFEGRPVCGHLVLRDEQLQRVGVVYTASTRLKNEDHTTFISSLNRWLHWFAMLRYKAQGIKTYDLCGLGTDTPEKAAIAYFKKSLGGTRVLEHNYVLARRPGHAAVALFYAMRQIRSGAWGFHSITRGGYQF
jgi:lipid II:glycine glycyltransferase (peptidoglycan interpeptide bridge formation enzyme)